MHLRASFVVFLAMAVCSMAANDTTPSSLETDGLDNVTKADNQSEMANPIKERFLPFVVPLILINRNRGNSTTSNTTTTVPPSSNLTSAKSLQESERAIDWIDEFDLADEETADNEELNVTSNLLNGNETHQLSERASNSQTTILSLESNFSKHENQSSKAFPSQEDDFLSSLNEKANETEEWTDDEDLDETDSRPVLLLLGTGNGTMNVTSNDGTKNASRPVSRIIQFLMIGRRVREASSNGSLDNSTSSETVSNRTRRDTRYGPPPQLPYGQQPQLYTPAYAPAYPAAPTEPASYDAMAAYAAPGVPYPPPTYAPPTPVSESYYTAPVHHTTPSYSNVAYQQPAYAPPAQYQPPSYNSDPYQQLDYAPAPYQAPSYTTPNSYYTTSTARPAFAPPAAPAPYAQQYEAPAATYPAPSARPAYAPPATPAPYAQQYEAPAATYPAPPARPAGLPAPPVTESPWF